MATGLLVILSAIHAAFAVLISVDKEYEGTIELGKITDSQGHGRPVMETRPVPALTEADLRGGDPGFLGDQYQIPPMYSAIKVDGVPLYKRAAKAGDRARAAIHPRHGLGCDALRAPAVRFQTPVHQGTYVRTLAMISAKSSDAGPVCPPFAERRRAIVSRAGAYARPDRGAFDSGDREAADPRPRRSPRGLPRVTSPAIFPRSNRQAPRLRGPPSATGDRNV